MVLPVFAIAFELVDISEGGLDDDQGGAQADEAEEGHEDVGSGDFHVWFDLTVCIIALFLRKAKGG